MPFKHSQQRIHGNICWFLAHSCLAKMIWPLEKVSCRNPHKAGVVENAYP
jgi:hypothetical protein